MPDARFHVIDDIQFLDVADAALELGVSVATVRRLCKSGQLAYLRRPSGHRLVRLDSVLAVKARLLSQPSLGPRKIQSARKFNWKHRDERVKGRALGIVVDHKSLAFACLSAHRRRFDLIEVGQFEIPSAPAYGKGEIDVVLYEEELSRLFERLHPSAVSLHLLDEITGYPARFAYEVVLVNILKRYLPFADCTERMMKHVASQSLISEASLNEVLRNAKNPRPVFRKAVIVAVCGLYAERFSFYVGPKQFLAGDESAPTQTADVAGRAGDKGKPAVDPSR